MSVIVAEDFLMPWYTQFLWYLLFGSMVLMAVGGNLIVIYIVIVDRKMRSVTNIFIVNLSIADAMNAIFNVVFNFIFMLHMHWPFGYIYCKFNQFIAVLSICASIFTLMAVSFDSYLNIQPSLKFKRTHAVGQLIEQICRKSGRQHLRNSFDFSAASHTI
ncbi:hypothetical protein HAZT_HAZT005128 [Hyalella azteca]|uniref:G-protein coupled receptors family 1 profile domain-containing protein n=1 Tax=Hyalella azteca TaxID=294128 RepID=A0A6A0GUP6_HYAAZ|nr:hypothetical protein HAZT_HAZT005128 [Hyalella azteca]